jgi:hypothetical protein
MNKLNFTVLILAIFFSFGEIYAARKIETDSRNYKHNSSKLEVSGRLRRLEEDASDLDRKLRRVKPDGSKRHINMTFERYKLALEMVHECHKYIETYGDKKQDTRLQDIRNLLKKESAILLKAMKDNKDFPYIESLTDIQTFMVNLRRGQGSFKGRLPGSDTKLRNEIHDQQKKALDAIHKSTLNKRRK